MLALQRAFRQSAGLSAGRQRLSKPSADLSGDAVNFSLRSLEFRICRINFGDLRVVENAVPGRQRIGVHGDERTLPPIKRGVQAQQRLEFLVLLDVLRPHERSRIRFARSRPTTRACQVAGIDRSNDRAIAVDRSLHRLGVGELETQ